MSQGSMNITGMAFSAYNMYMNKQRYNDTIERMNKALEVETTLAGAEAANAEFAMSLQKDRQEKADRYLPAYAALSEELEDAPNIAEEALPVTSAVAAGSSMMLQEPTVEADQTGMEPGSARRTARDSAVTAGTAVQMEASRRKLANDRDLEYFLQRRSAINVGKRYMQGA